jgi:hypothetical protein
MISHFHRIRRWLATRDRDLLILVAITLVGLLARWVFALGAALPDDDGYVECVKRILPGHYTYIPPVGQYEYRPAWLVPIAASLRLLGWTAHGLVLYPLITGAFWPLLTALWLRRHLPPRSPAPVLCAVILACYPVLFVDSLMLVNEMPLIFWCLLCVLFFGSAYARIADSAPTPRERVSWIVLALLAGSAFAAAYQVKVTAIPLLGIWLAAEFLLQVVRRGWPGRKSRAALSLASAVFVLPSFGVQLFYLAKTGDFLDNIAGEMRFYELKVPESYLSGQFKLDQVLPTYLEQLFLPFGPDGFRVLLHGPWIWVVLALGVFAVVFWRRLPAAERTVAFVFLGSALGLFLFFEFWPFRLRPYYLPISFDVRPWRYTDVFAPLVAAFAAIILTLPGVFDRWILGALRCCLLGACFGVCGYCLVVRYHMFEDNTADYRRAALESTTSLKSYCRLPQLIDGSGYWQFIDALGFPERSQLRLTDTRFLDLRSSPPVCIWTGGARREGLSPESAWSPDQMEVLGGKLVLIRTFAGLRRPWRAHVLQLWLFVPESTGTDETRP